MRSRLKYILLDINKSQTEIAEELGVKITYLNRIVNNRTVPSVFFLYKLSKILSELGHKKITIEDLYDWEN